ncbi:MULTISPECIES: aminotransferase class IV family protein [Stenotrophomonas]|uniref:aminotransferase class IV family protein n=1 Tax=Stenotrophomonas TaxID=40323 RepID=UPI000DA78690|nr:MULTISPECIES: aminotransferase class IV family protein [Stenotrophomonas]AYA89991.1 aminotransferase [Stenotrophomonas sp. Pemsol]MCU1005369.1 aminotransferase class IV family protein [Stenotrophomonas maltophilia]PZS94296.1 aminotransferase [Stenotrophomonas maltophilia]PZT20164.1 aminotransferase [Stenotrophomonas maltophilia]PZT41305.1 aminotransferase [Stenotrophomonas maltophilia]
MMVSCNGRAAQVEDLLPALVNYGHFTSLQVRGGAVQGLDLHLARLSQATRELFGSELDTVQVQAWMAQALQQSGQADASLRVTVYSRRFDFRNPLAAVPADVLVAVSAPVTLTVAKRVRSVAWQRELPQIKHVGTFGLFAERRAAMAEGFDDALFVTADGDVSEGSTWKLAVHDGERLLWPQAPALRGTAEALLKQHWPGPQATQPLRLADLAGVKAAFACNASGLWALEAIDGHVLPGSQALAEQGRAVLAAVAWDKLGSDPFCAAKGI